MSDAPRYRLDDLRRLASGLATGAGVPPARASALAARLLWFDAAGAPGFGIAALPGLLERLEAGEVDPKAEGAVVGERAGTAVFDARRGVPLLALARAGEIAAEKARDVGVALVRVENLPPPGPAAGVAAEMAVGPFAAAVLGPGTAWALALPGEGGLPVVVDPALSGGAGSGDGRGKRRTKGGTAAAPPGPGPWAGLVARALVPGDGSLVAAASVAAVEALAAVHERLAGALRGLDEADGRLLPGPWEARRRAAQAQGVAVAPAAWAELARRAGRLGVPMPEPAPAPAPGALRARQA